MNALSRISIIWSAPYNRGFTSSQMQSFTKIGQGIEWHQFKICNINSAQLNTGQFYPISINPKLQNYEVWPISHALNLNAFFVSAQLKCWIFNAIVSITDYHSDSLLVIGHLKSMALILEVRWLVNKK